MVASILDAGTVVRLRNKETQEYGEYFVQENYGGFIELIPLETNSMSIVYSHDTINEIYDAVAYADIQWDELID